MLEINRTADYVVLWKSHRRAERAAVGLARQAAELRGLLTASGLPELAVTAGVAVGAALAVPAVAVESLPGVTVGAAAAPAAEPAAVGAAVAAIESLPGVTVGTAAARPAGELVTVDGVAARAEAEFLEAESGRMWGLYAELGAELAQVAGLLTAAQRQTAEKVIQEWEEGGAG